jgi:hypothetical protein
MNPSEVLEAVQDAGGSLIANGKRIRYALPKSALWLIAELRQHRDEVLSILCTRQSEVLPMPERVELLSWDPKKPPVPIVQIGVVIDVPVFIRSTLEQLRFALAGKSWLAGNWSVSELISRLEQVGVRVAIEEDCR